MFSKFFVTVKGYKKKATLKQSSNTKVHILFILDDYFLLSWLKTSCKHFSLILIWLFAFLHPDLYQKWHLYQLLKDKEDGERGWKLLVNITNTRQKMQAIARNAEWKKHYNLKNLRRKKEPGCLKRKDLKLKKDRENVETKKRLILLL